MSTIVDWPAPTANSVPDAHAPPSCMPIANTAADEQRQADRPRG
ncbi:hypothetical protein AB0383_04820 [Amycolatopsis sp. NPDC051373]